MTKICESLHQRFNQQNRYKFPFDDSDIPLNGIYILFEVGEEAHDFDRIVRIGTHRGKDQLRQRLKQHFIRENKDRSIFRKNIGRAILNKSNDPFLEQWNLDLTSRKAKDEYMPFVDIDKQTAIEKQVTYYIQRNLSFTIFEVIEKEKRLSFESKIISTVSLCNDCRPSSNWLGNYSPKKKIRQSGLWLVNELYKVPLSESGLLELEEML